MNKKVALSLLSATVISSMAASAFAAPNSGIYMGGSVDRYYALSDLMNLNTQGLAKFNSDLVEAGSKNIVFVDFDKKGAFLEEIFKSNDGLEKVKRDLKQSDFEGVYTQVKPDGTDGATYDPRKDIDPEPAGELKVESVSAINGKTVEIHFSTPVDEDTVVDSNTGKLLNIKFHETTGAQAVTEASADAKLSEDGKTLTIYPQTTEYFGGTYTVEVSTDVKDANGTALASKYTSILTVNDTTAPQFVSATAKAKTSTTTFTLKFSEPVVVTSGVVKVNGVAAAVGAGSTLDELTVTTSSALEAGKTYNVELLNFTDFAGNLLASHNTTVTVEADTTAPAVTNVAVVGDSLIEVTFDKAINVSSLVKGTSVKLLDANANDYAAANIGTIVAKPNTSGKTIQFPLVNTPPFPFVNNSFQGTILFTDAVTDTAGNKIAPTSKSVSITKDTIAPSVASLSFKKASTTGSYAGVALTNGAIVIKFSEKVAKDATIVATNWKLIDNNGADVTSTYLTNAELTAAVVNADDETELVIPLKTAVTTASGITSFTVRMPAGQVDDLSLGANTNAAYVGTVAVEAGTTPANDTTAPIVSYIGVNANNQIELAVTEAEALDNSTVLNLNNYRLDAKPLPAGTYITIGTAVGGVYPVYINLPAGVTAESRDYSLNVSGIKDAAGNTSTAFFSNSVTLVDDVQPELTSATLNNDGTISLGFSEDLQNATDPAVTDLVVTINGKVLADTTAGGTVAYALTPVTVGAEAGKYVLTVSGVVDDGADSTSGTADDILYIDVDADGAFDPAIDIQVATGATVSAGAVSLKNVAITSVKVGTVAMPTTGADAEGNTLKGDTEITVK